jgi:tRNA pseudouridine55 synthase
MLNRKARPFMDGVLNVNKPSGMTSHDVVQAVRRILKQRRVGHTGTLDPLATGVLVLCVGQATRIARYLEAGDKEYKAVMRLGVTTDTLDSEGRVLETRSYRAPDRSQLLHALDTFVGSITQQPPAYSALKVGGVPSYKLARKGKAEPLRPRQITIYGIDLTAYDDPFVSITVRCSRGTYIRALCADLGETLGAGAHLTGLERTRSGRFAIDRSVTLDQLADAAASGAIAQYLVSLDEALADFPELAVEEADSTKILHGNRISLRPSPSTGENAGLIRVHDRSGRLLALARTAGGELQPELVFS